MLKFSVLISRFQRDFDKKIISCIFTSLYSTYIKICIKSMTFGLNKFSEVTIYIYICNT